MTKDNGQFTKGLVPWNKALAYSLPQARTGEYIGCPICKEDFYVAPWEIKCKRRFCSAFCYHESTKGKPSWNKGLKNWWSSPTQFKKGQTADDKNVNWKGDGVSYSGLHHWVKGKLGKPEMCICCSGIDELQWANKSYKYKRDIDDWISLCYRCHRKYDSGENWGKATRKYPEIRRKKDV